METEDEPADPIVRTISPLLKTAKQYRPSLVNRRSIMGRAEWYTTGNSGFLSDCLKRSNARLSASTLKPDVQSIVRREELDSLLSEEVTAFWSKVGGEPIELSGKDACETEGRNRVLVNLRLAFRHIREVGVIQMKAAIWLSTQALLLSQITAKDESTDERFTRLQEFWGQFHESYTRKPIGPRRSHSSLPSASSTGASASTFRGALASTYKEAPRGIGAAFGDTDGAAMIAPGIREDSGSPRSLDGAEEMRSTIIGGERWIGGYRKRATTNDKVLHWSTLDWGYQDSLTSGSALRPDSSARRPGTTLHNSQSSFTSTLDQFSWKQRSARSHRNVGRWGWSLPSIDDSSPPARPTTTASATNQLIDTWRQKAERVGTAAPEQCSRRQAKPPLSSFLMPGHMKKPQSKSSSSLPALGGAYGGRAGEARGGVADTRLTQRGTRSSARLIRLPTVTPPTATSDNVELSFAESLDDDCSFMERSFPSAAMDPLRASGSFQLPWRATEIAAMEAFSSPTGQYLQVCSDSGTLPALLPFVTGHSTKLEAAGKDLVDSDLHAVTTMVHGVPVERVDLGGSALLTDGAVAPLIHALLGPPSSDRLSFFSLRHCCALGSASLGALVNLVGDTHVGALHLRHLDISGVFLGVKSQLGLCKAVHAHPELHTVRLADTGLGKGAESGHTAQCLVELVSSKTVQELDLGWNCFTAEDFRQLGARVVEIACLRSLCLSNCSAYLDGCTPIVYFVEAVVRSRTLSKLDVSINRVDYRAALVCEDALEENTVLKELDVSSNPLGSHGMGALVRLLTRDASGLLHLICNGCSSHTEAGEDLFNASNPSGFYKLNLALPEDRARLRKLYKTCDRLNVQAEAAFSDTSFISAERISKASAKDTFQHPQKDLKGLREVLDKGVLRTRFSIEKALEAFLAHVDEFNFAVVLERGYAYTRLEVGTSKVSPLMALWRRFPENHPLLLDALSRNFTLPYAIVRALCGRREQTTEVLRHLIACMQGGRFARGLGLLLAPYADDMVSILRSARSFLRFNPQNPTGRYSLDLSDPATHAVAEMIQLLDRWEASIATRQKLLDTSQRGNNSFLRNELHGGRPLTAKSLAEWPLLDSGLLEFDYSSSKRPAVDASPVDDMALENMQLVLQTSECAASERVDAIRSLSHRMFLTCFQVRSLMGIFRESHNRLDLLVTVFFRITDVQNEKLFRVRFDNNEDIFELQDRLGYMAFFPYMQPEQTQFQFDFSCHDQRLAAHQLICLAAKEGYMNLKEPFVLSPDGTRDPLTMGVPRSWEMLDRIPRGGLLRAKYSCVPDDRKFELRKKALRTCGLWCHDFDEHAVMWWSTMVGVPDDVIQFVLFIVNRFDDLDVPFDKMRGNATTNSVITSIQFHKGAKDLEFNVCAGPNEYDRLKAVFRFLDPNSEGTVTRSEWGALQALWREILLSIENFVAFLGRMFEDDFESAWEFLDAKHSGQVSMETWSHLCNSSGYFGMVEPIHTYLDKDCNGYVTQEEFMLLEDFA